MRLVMKTDRLPGFVRQEKVEQARRLVADAAYPPREVLQKVAEKLASKVRIYRRSAKNRNN